MHVSRDPKQCIFPFLVLIVSWLLAVPLYKITEYEIFVYLFVMQNYARKFLVL